MTMANTRNNSGYSYSTLILRSMALVFRVDIVFVFVAQLVVFVLAVEFND